MPDPDPDDDEQAPARPATPSKVTLASPGVSVAVESSDPLAAVATQARQLHQDLADRYGSPPLRDGFGGAL